MSHPLSARLNDCLLRDRQRLRRRLHGLQKTHNDPELAARLEQAIDQSAAIVAQRRATLPKPTYPQGLPVVGRLEEIRATIRDNQVVVLCGETGSGKSTQLPKICLELGRGVFGRIGHTQPRRIAARSLAARIAEELGQEIGQSVGFKVRFHDRMTDASQVKLMTDGILLAEIQHDRHLNEYDTLIIDEAHERSLNIDFLLGYLRQVLPRRPDLKVIVTSATIDPERFSRHFGAAPILEVSGRTYPVEVRYMAPDIEAANDRDDAIQQAIIDAVDELGRVDRGDILVFLPGEREIREAAERLRKHRLPATEVLPLYARLSPAEQARIFHPSGARRIVLATNVAETSLTVPGIRYVIDSGVARISRYSARSKIQRLPVEPVSQASANQRKGRCGRVAAGICIRLYEEEDFTQRAEFTEPEIHRTNLAAVILQMKALGFGDIESFPFVDPPESRMIRDGYRVLEELGAVDTGRRISKLGRSLARLPIDPRIGRMLLEAAHTGCQRELLVIAAALSVQDPRDRPIERQKDADEAHAVFADERSDFMTYLKLWNFLQENRRHLTRRKFARMCRAHFLSATRVREWQDIHAQLRATLHEQGYRDNDPDASYEAIHMAILSGLLSHVGLRSQGRNRDYLGARNTHFMIFPGSALFREQPKWLVAAELVETSRLYARTVAGIDPAWVESLAAHLVKRSYSEAHWQARRGQVGAYEKVSLFGLPVVARRRVNYGPIAPDEAHGIFLRFGLTEGDMHTRAPFWRHNQGLVADLHAQEAKSRRRDILVDEEAIHAFYAKRVPQEIHSVAQLEAWLRKLPRSDAKVLHMRLEDLLHAGSQLADVAQFPDHLLVHHTRLPLVYHFEPGSAGDGVTLRVPLGVLNQLEPGHVDWLVPGLVREKIITLIKGLPKALRRQFVPVPDVVDRCLGVMRPGEAPLLQSLGAALKQLTGVHVPEDAWKGDQLPDFLCMRIAVLDADGRRVLAASRDLHALQRDQGGAVTTRRAAEPDRHALECSGRREWDFGALPDSVTISRAGVEMRTWPALVDEGDAVGVRLMDAEAAARHAHRLGLRRLFMLRQVKLVRYLRKNLPGLAGMRLQYAKAPSGPGAGDAPDIERELIALAFDRTYLGADAEIRDGEAFERRLHAHADRLVATAEQAAATVAEVLAAYHGVSKALGSVTQVNWLSSVADMRRQLDRLVYRGFLHDVDPERLAQYPRYLKALELRIDKLRHAAARDQQGMREMAAVLEQWQARDAAARDKGLRDPRLDEIRWQLEELRISLFAQEVKTAHPVSVKRIRKRWEALGL